MVITSPVVAWFPADSGAQEIVLGISLMWGVVAGCVVAVFSIGSYRRMHAGTQIEALNEAESVPLEMIGRPIARRSAANDRRVPAPQPPPTRRMMSTTSCCSTQKPKCRVAASPGAIAPPNQQF